MKSPGAGFILYPQKMGSGRRKEEKGGQPRDSRDRRGTERDEDGGAEERQHLKQESDAQRGRSSTENFPAFKFSHESQRRRVLPSFVETPMTPHARPHFELVRHQLPKSCSEQT
eukprot:2075171-Rhodomonas_salina.2